MRCIRCKEEKELECFTYRKNRKKYNTFCNECKNKRTRELHAKNKDALNERRRELWEQNKEAYNEGYRRRYWQDRDNKLAKAKLKPSYGKPHPEANKKWRSKNKEKMKAHRKLNWAIKTGKILRMEECQMCNKKGKHHGHHHDYNKPLDVIWLCTSCHSIIHSKYFKQE